MLLTTLSALILIKITKVDSLIYLPIHRWKSAIFLFADLTSLCEMILEGCSIMSVNWKELLRLFIITLLIRLEI